MIGIFDSGEGGLNTLGFLRRRLSKANIIFLRDRKNAPYGEKAREELIEITERNIGTLKSMGASKILIACCTASSLADSIDVSLSENVIPIIKPTADAALAVAKDGIAVIATDFTVSCGAFAKAIAGHAVTEIAAQPLVSLVESGEKDGRLCQASLEKIEAALSKIPRGCDTLILGCTHFSSLRETVGKIAAGLGIKNIIDSAQAGANALLLGLDGKDEGLGLTYRLTT